jgi:hypothetical protein
MRSQLHRCVYCGYFNPIIELLTYSALLDGQNPSGVTVNAVSSTAADGESGDNAALRVFGYSGSMLGVGASFSLILLSGLYVLA